MIYSEGYVYHIKDSYFNKVNDNKLMANKENGNFRPTYYCFKDTQTSLLWVVPMSSKYQKYEKIFNNKVQKYGKCDTIILGEFDNVPIFVLGIIVCLLCGFLYFIFLIKKYIPNVQVGQDNESSKSMMFAAPAFVMAVRPILLSFSPIPTIQFLIYGVLCATFVMAVEWGTRAYLAKLYNLK